MEWDAVGAAVDFGFVFGQTGVNDARMARRRRCGRERLKGCVHRRLEFIDVAKGGYVVRGEVVPQRMRSFSMLGTPPDSMVVSISTISASPNPLCEPCSRVPPSGSKL